MAFRNLNRSLATNRYYPRKPRRSWKQLFVWLLILVVVFYLPLRGIYQSSQSLLRSAKAASQGLKNNNLDEVRKNIDEMKNAQQGLSMSLNFLIWIRVIPWVGNFYADARHFADATEHELVALGNIVEIIEPYRAELGFTGSAAPSQDKIAQVAKILGKVIPQLDKIEPDLTRAGLAVSSIDSGKYPEKVGKFRARASVEALKNFITGAGLAVSRHRDALEVAPQALGEPEAKSYLLIFQNDKELRATGGFMTAYAFLRLDKGRVSTTTSDDIYRLDEKLLQVCLTKICPLAPPAPIIKYLPEEDGEPRTAWSMRDSNLSADLPTSVREFERMYSLLGEGLPFDGILLIDTHVVEEMIKITGPVEVFGTKYSAEIDQRCNCPNVIYELESYAQVIEKGEQDRKAILGTLMSQILARAIGSSAEQLLEFVDVGVRLAGGKHIQLFMHDGKTQQALSKLNWTGEIKDSTGDYLHINDSNFAGGKSNLYVEEDVNLDINIDKGGKVKNKLTIQYKNPQPYNTWLNGINRDYVRIYVPAGAKLVSSKGSQDPVTTIEKELDKTVFEAFIQVRPQNSLKLEFEYQLPGQFNDQEYPLLIQKQAGTKDFKYTIKINGKKKSEFKLDGDQELRLVI